MPLRTFLHQGDAMLWHGVPLVIWAKATRGNGSTNWHPTAEGHDRIRRHDDGPTIEGSTADASAAEPWRRCLISTLRHQYRRSKCVSRS